MLQPTTSGPTSCVVGYHNWSHILFCRLPQQALHLVLQATTAGPPSCTASYHSRPYSLCCRLPQPFPHLVPQATTAAPKSCTSLPTFTLVLTCSEFTLLPCTGESSPHVWLRPSSCLSTQAFYTKSKSVNTTCSHKYLTLQILVDFRRSSLSAKLGLKPNSTDCSFADTSLSDRGSYAYGTITYQPI